MDTINFSKGINVFRQRGRFTGVKLLMMRSFIRHRLCLCMAVGLEMLLAGSSSVFSQGKPGSPVTQTKGYWRTSTCKGCHDQIVAQHLASSHERSFTNPAFQAQYQKDLLPKAATDPDLQAEARECIACHEPVTYAMKGPGFLSLREIDPDMNGVTCDICHSMTGYRDAKPQNGNYIIEPSDRKLGPFKGEGDWHHTYSELQTKSEICAVCHEAVNRHGLRIKATFTEWQESAFAQQGVHCQDCHMNIDGFLTSGKPRFASGTGCRHESWKRSAARASIHASIPRRPLQNPDRGCHHPGDRVHPPKGLTEQYACP